MTFVIQFVYEKRPTVIADTLVSLPSKFKSIKQQFTVPTYSGQDNIISDSGHLPSGLKQKINLINEKLAVSWSGREIYARSLLERLIHENSQQEDVFQVINEFMNELGPKGDDLQINVLSLDGINLHQAHWNMESVPVHPFGEVTYGGSGQGDMIGYLASLGCDLDKTYPMSAKTRSETVFYHVLGTFFSAFSTSYISGWGLKNSWGGPLELLYSNGAALEKLDDYLIVFWFAVHESDKSAKFGFLKRIIKVKYVADLLIMKVVEFSDKGPGSEKYFVSEPLINMSKRPDVITTDDISWESKKVYHFIRVHNHPSLIVSGSISNWDEFSKDCSIHGYGKNVGFSYSTDFPKKRLLEMGYENLNSYEFLKK